MKLKLVLGIVLCATSACIAGGAFGDPAKPAAAPQAQPAPSTPPASVAPPASSVAPAPSVAPAQPQASPVPPTPDQQPPQDQPPPNPLHLTDAQQAQLQKIKDASNKALEDIASNTHLSHAQKVAKVVALNDGTKAKELAVLDKKQRTMVMTADSERDQQDPIHLTVSQRAQITLLQFTMRSKAMAIIADKHRDDKAKMASLQQLDGSREVAFEAILTPQQRKIVAQLRSMQQQMSQPPPAQH